MPSRAVVQRALRAVSTLLCAAACAGCAGTAEPPPRIDPEVAGRAVTDRYLRAGSGSPTVVLQAGLTDGKEVWNKVLPKLAHHHAVIALDRPGRGTFPASDAPRDPCSIAAEQRAMLRAAGLRPPYLLVGHSLGGLYQFVYAKLYPEEVAGMVLLDPTHPRHLETVKQATPGSATMLQLMRVVAFSETDRREFDAQTECLDRLDLRHPPRMPVRILVSGRFRPEERGAFEKFVKALRQDWLTLTGASKLGLVLDSTHYIQKDNPDAVVAAVRQLAEMQPR